METKTASITAAVIGTLFAALAAFTYWQAVAVVTNLGYPVPKRQTYLLVALHRRYFVDLCGVRIHFTSKASA